MILTFPLDYFVVRYTFQRIAQRLCGCTCDGSGRQALEAKGLVFSPVITREHFEGRGHAADMSLVSHVFYTFLLWGLCLGVCIAALSLGGQGQGLRLVLQFTGSIGATFTSFVFPTAIFLCLGDGSKSLTKKNAELWCPCMPSLYSLGRYIFAVLVLIFGLTAGVVGTWSSVVDAMSMHGRNATTPS